jgi:hypothetical protein
MLVALIPLPPGIVDLSLAARATTPISVRGSKKKTHLPVELWRWDSALLN